MNPMTDLDLDHLAALARTVPLTGTDLTELAAAVPALVARVREAEAKRSRAWDEGFAEAAERGFEASKELRRLYIRDSQALIALRDAISQLAETRMSWGDGPDGYYGAMVAKEPPERSIPLRDFLRALTQSGRGVN